MKVIHCDGKVIAFHKKEKVAKKFIKNYRKSNTNKICLIANIPDKYAKAHPRFEELYLEKYGSTYIQAEYLYIHQLSMDDEINDLERCRETLVRLVECCDKNKEVNALWKSIYIVENRLQELETETPELRDLEEADSRYSEYRRKFEED